MVAHCRLGGRRVNRRGQLGGVLQPGGQLDAAHRLVVLVFLPAAARQIAAHHRFDRQGFEALDQHRAPDHLRHLGGAHHALGRVTGEVDRADVQTLGAQLVKPEQRHLRQQRALAGNRLAHDHVKRTQAVAGDHQDAVVADGVVVAHLATG